MLNEMHKTKNNLILAVSSRGGHEIQLRRIINGVGQVNCVYVHTVKDAKSCGVVDGVYNVIEASRWSKRNVLRQGVQVFRIFIKERPRIVISTGASCGLWAILIGRMLGCKAIWIDSIANAEKLSMSGRLCRPFCTNHYTQWPHLASGKTKYVGSVLG